MLSDTALMRRIARKDEGAVREFIDRFAPLIGAMACERSADPDDTRQEVYLRVWKYARTFNRRKAKLTTWVGVIVQRTINDERRKALAAKRPPRPLSLDMEECPLSVAAPELAAGENIEPVLSCLTPGPREVLGLVYGRGMSLKAAAAAMKRPLGTIKSDLSRGLGRIRRGLF